MNKVLLKDNSVTTVVRPGSIWASEDGDVYILCIFNHYSDVASETKFMTVCLSDGHHWGGPKRSAGEAVDGLTLKFAAAKISVEPYES